MGLIYFLSAFGLIMLGIIVWGSIELHKQKVTGQPNK